MVRDVGVCLGLAEGADRVVASAVGVEDRGTDVQSLQLALGTREDAVDARASSVVVRLVDRVASITEDDEST